MAIEVNNPGSPSNDPDEGPDSTRTREGAMNIPSRRVGSEGSSGGGADVAGGGAEGGPSSSSLVRSITIAPGGGAFVSLGQKWPKHNGINGNIEPCVWEVTHTKANGLCILFTL